MTVIRCKRGQVYALIKPLQASVSDGDLPHSACYIR